MAVKRRDAPPIWARPAPGSRRPRLTREQIAAAALGIADRHGFAAVSMRRLAEELGTATMTLYYYVRTKEDLVSLMDDTLMGEVLLSDEELAGGWRAALSAIAHKFRATFRRHPWALHELRGARAGPNTMRHVEQSLAAVAELELETKTKLELIAIVDDFVFGHVMRSASIEAEADDDADKARAIMHYMSEQMASGAYPHMAALLGDADAATAAEAWIQSMQAESVFERGLSAILDAVERWPAARDAVVPVAPKQKKSAKPAPARRKSKPR